MKYLLTTTLLVFSFILCVNAQLRERTCHFGITFEISNNPNWGYGEPVILTVEPNSPADIAGVRPGDIIMEINGSATYLRNYQTITSWLFDDTSDMAVFTIRNLSNYFREYELPRRCRSVKSMDEADLASAFSFYSIEDTQERAFVLPLKVTTNKNVDFSDYHTFDFILDPNAPQVDSYINKLLEDALKIKGLTRNTEDPDFFIQTYYSYQPNPKFNAYEKNVDKRTWRFDSENKQMVSLPILSGDNPSAEYEGNFILELGLRFFEKKIY
ncbi:MAG: PDZ domain-containing protein [Dysgonomonas sp.]